MLKVHRLNDNAIVPTKAHSADAGFDIYADDDYTIHAHERVLIGTSIAMNIPKGYYGQIKDRSGVAYKMGGHVLAGVIDCDYRGEVKVLMLNTTTDALCSAGNAIYIKKGERVAQMVLLPVPEFDIIEVNDLDDTERGVGGFGSSGK